MKIALFTENFYQGGLDTYIITLINNWPIKEDEFILICNKMHPGISRYEKEIERKTTFIWHKHFHKSYFDNFIIRNLKSIILMKIIRRILSNMEFFIFYYYLLVLKKTLLKYNPDSLIVVNGGYPGGLSCRAATICWGKYSGRKKSIHNFHNIALPTTKTNLFQNYIDKLVERYSASLISVSYVAAESIRNRWSFRDTNKLSFIYNGVVNNNESDFIDLREEFSIKKDFNVCLMLGTYEPRKGHIFILNVFKKVLQQKEKVVLVICGYGSIEEKRNVVDYAYELDIYKNIIFLDFRDDINNLFSMSDILLIGSQKFESFGLTAVEAMLNNVPVVSTNVGGLREVIKNNSGGFLFDKNDELGFSDKIVALLDDKNLRVEQGFLGKQRVDSLFSASKMAQKYCEEINRK